MKRKLHPGVVSAVLVAAVLGLLWYFQYETAGKYPLEGDPQSMPMPKEAAEGMAKMRQKLDEQMRQNKGGR